jgi:ribosomal protein S20
MPIIKSAIKRAKQSAKRRAHNVVINKNTAARRKANLAKIAKEAGVKLAAAKKAVAKAAPKAAPKATAKPAGAKKAPAKKPAAKK